MVVGFGGSGCCVAGEGRGGGGGIVNGDIGLSLCVCTW